MYRISLLISLFVFQLTCSAQTFDSLSVKYVIHANNLSEDMSSISSKDDELLVLIYRMDYSEILSAPVFTTQMKVDNQIPETSSVFKLYGAPNEKFIMILLEQDDMTPLQQMDPILRIHHLAILQAFEEKNRTLLETYLGDEDLLGMEQIELNPSAPLKLHVRGIHKMDRFDYLIEFKATKI